MIGILFYGLLLLSAVILTMLTRIKFDVAFTRDGSDDNLKVRLTAFRGLVKYDTEIPVVDIDRLFIEPIIKLEADIESVVSHSIEDKGMLLKVPVMTILRNLPAYIRHGLARADRYNSLMKSFLKRIRCIDLQWKTEVGLDDPAYTGILSGLLWGIKGTAFSFFNSNVGAVLNQPRLSVRPCFNGPCLKLDFRCIFDIRIGHIIITGLKFVKLRFKSY